MGSRVVPTTASPDPRWFNTNNGTGRSTVRSQAIVMSAGKQIGQASKQQNEQCESNPPKGFPQAESHKSVDSASQGGYQWQFANCEQEYATLAPRLCRARRTALRRGATHPRATVADRAPRGMEETQLRPTPAQGASNCPAARGHAPARHGRGQRAAWRGGRTPPLRSTASVDTASRHLKPARPRGSIPGGPSLCAPGGLSL